MTSYQQRKQEIRDLERKVERLEQRLNESGIEFGQLSIGKTPELIFDYNELMCLYRELRQIIPQKRNNTMKALLMHVFSKIEDRIIEIDESAKASTGFTKEQIGFIDVPKYKGPPQPPAPPAPPPGRTILHPPTKTCPKCGSSTPRSGFMGLFGKRYCINKKCINSKK